MPEIRSWKNLAEDVTIWRDTPKEEVRTISILWEMTFTGVLILSAIADGVGYRLKMSYHYLEDEGDEYLSLEHFLGYVAEEIEKNLTSDYFVEA